MTKEVGALSRQEKKVSKEMRAFGRYDNGFTLNFENGLVLSTRFGVMNYCENKSTNVPDDLNKEDNELPLVSANAEVAVWLNNSESKTSYDWVNGWQEDVFDDAEPADDVRGWVTMSEWLQIVDWCRDWKPE
jgi:hypothetical protein|tara:strand:- start:666 stop:1061 length:396 start_codon:yes stop_codon:yes gene_type:complete